MSDINENIVRKVKALFALANGGATEAEAASATAKAQELLARYNLSLSALGDASQPVADTGREKRKTSISAAYDWQKRLMKGLCENNFCVTWHETVIAPGKTIGREKHIIVGRTANVANVIHMYEYLTGAAERLLPEWSIPYKQNRRGQWANAWFLGCVDRIINRLDLQRMETEAAVRTERDERRGNGSDLVLSDVYSSEADLNNDLMFGYAPGFTAQRNRQRQADYAATKEARKAAWDAEIAKKLAERAAETSAERIARIKREAAEQAAYERKYRKWENRRPEIKNADAYQRGSEAGKEIGLNRQIS